MQNASFPHFPRTVYPFLIHSLPRTQTNTAFDCQWEVSCKLDIPLEKIDDPKVEEQKKKSVSLDPSQGAYETNISGPNL